MIRMLKAPRCRRNNLIISAWLACVISAVLVPTDAAAEEGAGAKQISVLTTIGMIADIAGNISGADVSVASLMGPGVDPHLYRATQGDLKKLLAADIIFYNGLHLEGKMVDVLEKLAHQKRCVAVTSSISRDTLRAPPEFSGNFDPHVWFDVKMWIQASRVVAEELSKYDESRRTSFSKRAEEYIAKLLELDAWVQSEIARIPAARRVLITAHDAFGYFGRAYGIEVMGLQGISTATEFGLYDVKHLVDVIIKRKVKAIFVESSVPRKMVLSLQEGVRARGFNVEIGGQLFSDAMGEPGTVEGTYMGMVRHNVTTIVNALK